MSTSSNTVWSELSGARVTIMGLGAHGGGAASARFCVEAGADVTVTDLRDERELSGSLDAISDLPVRLVLGRHEVDDFRRADLVVKNPAVRRTAPLLAHARRIETDISLFLADYRGPVLAITGTKGKSTTASALHHILIAVHPGARLGGNITVSPLTFSRALAGSEPVVLELSSFQLGDLPLTTTAIERRLPSFRVSVITNLMPDHQDYYHSMADYAADKGMIFRNQGSDDWCLLSDADEWSRAWSPPHLERTVRISGANPVPAGPNLAGFDGESGVLRLPDGESTVELVPARTAVSGPHMRRNLLFAGAAARLFGVNEQIIRERNAGFPGVPHRLELVGEAHGIRYVNDSAATIAEATVAALASYAEPVHLIAGGSDKSVPLDAFAGIARSAASIHLLAGTATDRITEVLDRLGLSYSGPYDSLRAALRGALRATRPGDVVLLSPGCASFGMFRNEFDRGDQFRALVQESPDMIR